MDTPAWTAQQQREEELCAATARALAGDSRLRFRSGTGAGAGIGSGADELAALRGDADLVAMLRRHSDLALHRQVRPAAVAAGTVFDLLEQFRVESLVPDTLPGVAANLSRRNLAWLTAFRDSTLIETEQGLLLFTLVLVCRSRVLGAAIDPRDEDLIEATRFALAPLIGPHVARLRRHRSSQSEYAVAARAIAECAGAALHGSDAATRTSASRGALALVAALVVGEHGPDQGPPGPGRDADAVGARYRVFSSAYDVEERASQVVRPAALRELRERLDGLVSERGANLNALVADLRSVVSAPADDGWDGHQEEGLIDGRSLARLIVSADERHVFRRPRQGSGADCVISFLVDCSGSMRRHSETLAVHLDLLLRALDLAGAATELLGFTTRAWNGGRPLREWERAGRPAQPGRLNERRHLVLKDADTSWRRARPGIAALLREDLYREGIDGEAVQWAAGRMWQRDERRKLLVVISDGSPMDSATARANGGQYLDRHLREVVDGVQAAGDVRVAGLGVGLDLRPFYPVSGVLDAAAEHPDRALHAVAALLARSAAARAAKQRRP